MAPVGLGLAQRLQKFASDWNLDSRRPSLAACCCCCSGGATGEGLRGCPLLKSNRWSVQH